MTAAAVGESTRPGWVGFCLAGQGRDPCTVSAAALLLNFAHCHLLRLMGTGVERRTAFRQTATWFFHRLLPASGHPLGAAVPIGEEPDALTSSCLARGAALSRDVLATDWDVWLATEPRAAHAVLAREDVARCIWLAECTRRVAEGQQLLAAARGAHDAAAGRVRQQRRPVELDWLAGQVGHAIEAARPALVAALTPAGRRFLVP